MTSAKRILFVGSLFAAAALLSLTPGPAVAQEAAETPAVASRETFSSVVIAGLPPAMSAQLEDFSKSLAAASGAALVPEWWKLDMAAFSVATPVRGAELAAKLGLTVISDVGDDLILAPEDSPQARQAEARVYLMRLMNRRDQAPMWDAIQAKSGLQKEDRGMSRSSNIRIVNGRVVHGPDPSQAPVSVDPEETFLSYTGTLEDPKVLAGLGLTPEMVNRPLRHYRIQDFQVGPYSPAQQGGYRRRYYSYGMGDEPTRSRGSLVIWAKEGVQQPEIPTGPDLGFGSGFSDAMSLLGRQMVFRAMAGFAGMGSSYSSWYENPNSDKPAENALYVGMLLEDFRAVRRRDPASPLKIQDEMRKLTAGLGEPGKVEADKIKKAMEGSGEFRDLVLSATRNMLPRRVTWADKSAVAMMKDPEDRTLDISVAKNALKDKMVKVLQDYVRTKGAGAEFKEGRLGDWDLKQHYGYDWGHFDHSPYDDYQLEIAKETAAGLENQIVFKTTEGMEEALAFSMRIEPDSGFCVWTLGEPESEEAIAGRALELYTGTAAIANALRTNKETSAPDQKWVQQHLTSVETPFKYVSVLDFTVTRLGPGYWRVVGEGPSAGSRQAAIVNGATGAVSWETQKPKPKKVEVEVTEPSFG